MKFLTGALYKKVTNFTLAFVVAVSSLTAIGPFLFSDEVGAAMPLSSADVIVDKAIVTDGDTTTYPGKRAYNDIPSAVTAAAAGQTIVVRDGLYSDVTPGYAYLRIAQGKAVKLHAENTHGAVINVGVVMRNSGGYTFDGFHIKDVTGDYGLWLDNPGSPTIPTFVTNNKVTNISADNGLEVEGIFIGDSAKTYSNVTVSGNQVSGVSSTTMGVSGIGANGTGINLTITNNTISNVARGINTAALKPGSSAQVTNNTVYDNVATPLELGPYATQSGNITTAPDAVKPTVQVLNIGAAVFNKNDTLSIQANDNQALYRVVGNIRNSAGTLVLPTQSNASGQTSYVHNISLNNAVLTEGNYTLRYNAEDVAGNASNTMTYAFTIDNTVPTISILNPSLNTLHNDDITVSGVVNDNQSLVGQTVSVQLRTPSVGNPANCGGYTGGVFTTTVQADGSWSLAIDSSLYGDGKYCVSATVTDVAGNAASNGGTHLKFITIDNSDPAIDFVGSTPAAGSYIKGTNSIQVKINDLHIGAYNLRIENGAPSPLSLGLDYINQPVNDAVNIYAWNTKTGLKQVADGQHKLVATTVDKAGNRSTATRSVFVDNTKPVVTLASPVDAGSYNPSSIVLDATDNMGLKAVTANIYDADNADLIRSCSDNVSAAATSYSLTRCSVAGLPDATYTIHANASDLAGNIASTISRTFVVDTTAPEAPVLTGESTRYIQPGTVVRTWNKSNSTDVTEYQYKSFDSELEAQNPETSDGWSPSPYAAGQESYSISGPTGSNNRTLWYRVAATDAAGNKTWSEDTFKIVVDKDAPIVEISDVALSIEKLLTFTVNGTDNLSGAETVGVNIYNADNTGSPVIAIGRIDDNIAAETLAVGPYVQSGIDVSGLATGTYTIRAAIRDYAGNISYATQQFTVDNTAPGVTVQEIARTNDTTPLLQGTVDPSAVVVRVTVNGQTYNVTPTGETWSVTLNELTNGTYGVSVVAEDAAGNVTDPPVTTELVIDTQAPSVVIDEPAAAVTFDTTPTITGTYEDLDAFTDTTVTISINGGTSVAVVNNNDGTWSYTPADALVDGEYTFVATASDNLGNSTTSNEVTVEVDTTAPAFVYDGFTQEGNVITPDLDITGDVETFFWTADAANPTGASFDDSVIAPAFTVINTGTYNFTLRAIDAVGNFRDFLFTFAYTAPEPETEGENVASAAGTPAIIPFSAVAGAVSDEGVLGETDDSQAAESGAADVEGASTVAAVDTDATDGTIFGLAWYWWLLILAALAAAAWWIIGAIRRRNAEEQ